MNSGVENSGSGEKLARQLALGLWERLRELALVHRRLENFVLHPETVSKNETRDSLLEWVQDEEKLGRLSRELTLRVFRVALEADNFEILLALKGKKGVVISELAIITSRSELLLGERVKDLMQAGLANYSFESSRVELTKLAENLISLIEETTGELSQVAAERLPSIIGK
jgi:hypothetical protein